MKVLGLDPGMKRLGFGIVERTPDGIELTDFGYFITERDPAVAFNVYLNQAINFIAEKFPGILHDHAPTMVAAETVPVGKLAANTELVVAAITVCKVVSFQFGIPWVDYGANTVKATVAGEGTATKAKVRNAVITRFPNIEEAQKIVKAKQKEAGKKPQPGIAQDVFDGCAVALTGLLKHEEKHGIELDAAEANG